MRPGKVPTGVGIGRFVPSVCDLDNEDNDPTADDRTVELVLTPAGGAAEPTETFTVNIMPVADEPLFVERRTNISVDDTTAHASAVQINLNRVGLSARSDVLSGGEGAWRFR